MHAATDTTHSGEPGPPLPAPGRRTRTTSMRAPAVHRQRRPVQSPDYARYLRPGALARAAGLPAVLASAAPVALADPAGRTTLSQTIRPGTGAYAPLVAGS